MRLLGLGCGDLKTPRAVLFRFGFEIPVAGCRSEGARFGVKGGCIVTESAVEFRDWVLGFGVPVSGFGL